MNLYNEEGAVGEASDAILQFNLEITRFRIIFFIKKIYLIILCQRFIYTILNIKYSVLYLV